MAAVVLDNGAYNAKIGLSTDDDPKLVPNSVIKAKNVRNRVFIGDQIDDCKDLSSLYYLLAFQKGYLVNWEVERQIWDHIFHKDRLKVNHVGSSLVFTEPYFNFSAIREVQYETLFEDYQFKEVHSSTPAFLAQYKYGSEKGVGMPLCCIVVDSGYSFTHIVPFTKGKPIKEAVKRLNVGGKILTNHLKEVISYRQLMVMDETYVMNQMKEDVCYVALDFNEHMDIARKKGEDNSVVRDYVLPDYTHIKRGHIRPIGEKSSKSKESEQVIRMNNERFAIPEVLFHPSDIGIQEMGIAEAVCHAISCTPEEMHPHMYANIVLMGGNCVLPGFKDRLYADVRKLCPDLYDVSVHMSNSPATYAWDGGSALSKDPQFKTMCVSQQEYNEHGVNACMDTFIV